MNINFTVSGDKYAFSFVYWKVNLIAYIFVRWEITPRNRQFSSKFIAREVEAFSMMN